MTETVKGFERLLTAEDIGEIIGRPARFVRVHLFRTGAVRTIKFGGNSYRVRPVDFADYLAKGQTGFRGAKPSGRWPAGK